VEQGEFAGEESKEGHGRQLEWYASFDRLNEVVRTTWESATTSRAGAPGRGRGHALLMVADF